MGSHRIDARNRGAGFGARARAGNELPVLSKKRKLLDLRTHGLQADRCRELINADSDPAVTFRGAAERTEFQPFGRDIEDVGLAATVYVRSDAVEQLLGEFTQNCYRAAQPGDDLIDRAQSDYLFEKVGSFSPVTLGNWTHTRFPITELFDGDAR